MVVTSVVEKRNMSDINRTYIAHSEVRRIYMVRSVNLEAGPTKPESRPNMAGGEKPRHFFAFFIVVVGPMKSVLHCNFLTVASSLNFVSLVRWEDWSCPKTSFGFIGTLCSTSNNARALQRDKTLHVSPSSSRLCCHLIVLASPRPRRHPRRAHTT
jgi:hypothetical protein